jgi:N6-adenosine-specific RNA methylase IME4
MMKAHPIADLFPMLEGAELDALVLSMKTHGFDPSHPVIVLEGLILDGRNRAHAAEIAGIEPVTKEWSGGDPWDFVWRENAVRRHLEPGQRAAVHLAFVEGSEAWQRERAARVEAANRKHSESARQQPRDERGRVQPKPVVTPRGAETVRECDRLATSAGVGARTMARAIELRAKAPEQFDRVKRGEVALNKALGEVKLAAKRELAETIRANPVVTPDGRYQVIVSDPPWKYDTRAEDTSHRGKNQYPDMTTEEICALPVGALAQDNCVLWLWTTNAFMRDAYRCLDAWGFREKTILTWDKELMGLGDWLRNVTEHCILAVKGKPIVSLTNQTTMIREKRREHSRKPVAFYEMVEALCPGSKLEMFSRTPREGWGAWGAETEKFHAAE